MMKTLGIVIPTRWEAGIVLRRFSFKRAASSLYKSSISDRPILLCISGVGGEAARCAANRLVSEGAKELMSMGFCGALVPTLKVGDLVTHRIATVDKPVRTPEERRALTERANAVAVDMETQAIIEAGTRRGVPIHVLRVVSDEFEDDLTPLFGTDGIFSPWRIALRLVNPKVWPLAMKLKKQSRTCSVRLAEELAIFCSAAQ
jgi:nucleoside phosphorylase